MKVKELITRLLDESMGADVMLNIKEQHKSEHGICSGYSFQVDSIEQWSGDKVFINFTDWRAIGEQQNPESQTDCSWK